MRCEVCGKDVFALNTIDVNGAYRRVCTDCETKYRDYVEIFGTPPSLEPPKSIIKLPVSRREGALETPERVEKDKQYAPLPPLPPRLPPSVSFPLSPEPYRYPQELPPGGREKLPPPPIKPQEARAIPAPLSTGAPRGIVHPLRPSVPPSRERGIPTERRKVTEAAPKRKVSLFERLFMEGIPNFMRAEFNNLEHMRVLAFFILAILGAAWVPFYSWWMILVIGLIVGAISYKYPYVSLIVLIIFVMAATAYQTPEFGIVFAVYSLIILICGLFEWRLGFLVFLTIFVSRLGIPFVVPMIATLYVSILITITTTVLAGIFLTFLVTVGNLNIVGFFVGPPHKYSYMVFDKPYLTNFTLGDLLSAFSSIPNADPYFIVEVMGTNMAHAMASVIQIVIWCFAVWVVSFLAKKVEDVSFKDWAICTVAPATLIICGFLGASSQFGYPIELGTGALLFGIVGVIGVLIGFCLMLRETVTGATPGEAAAGELLGTKIGELESVRGFGFDMIGGLRDVKNEIKEAVVVPLTRPELSEKFGISPPKGILLFGPPGCGKTMLMRALAAELQVEMVSVKCSDIMSKWYGESEEKIAGLFATAKKRKPCILFLDEIDAIAKSRDMYGADDVTPRLLSIMLSEMDGMDKTTGVVVVATTNKPELLDPALLRPGRFDKVIYVPPPDYHERLDILRVHFAGKPIAPDVDIDLLAKRTERFSGADLANLVKEAATIAMRRALQQSEHRKAGVSTRSS